MKREDTKRIYVGNVAVGNGARVTVQSMTNTDTKDIESTVKQIKEFESVGCDISRSATVSYTHLTLPTILLV